MMRKIKVLMLAFCIILEFWNSALAENFKSVAFWGSNLRGELNLPANDLNDLVALDAGENNSAFVRQGGVVLMCGYSGLGVNNVPVGLSNVTSVAIGGTHGLALKMDGTVTAWSSEDGDQVYQPNLWSNITAIATGYNVSLGLQTNGTVLAGGENFNGEVNLPVGLTNVVAIAAGRYHCLALKSGGTVVGWGQNSAGQTNIPIGLTNVSAITAGFKHSVALLSNGTVVAWGDNTWGQCTVPAGATNVIQISAGLNHTLALRSDGTMIAWGDNTYGQVSPLPDTFRATVISAGGDQNLALTTSGPPILLSYPVSTSISAGESLRFPGMAVGIGGSLSYQWLKNGTNLPGATGNSMFLFNVQAGDGGLYSVMASNSFGSVTSTPALLNVIASAPVVTAQPAASRALVLGSISPMVFVVQAIGSEPLSYQWQLSGNAIAGATQSAFGITNFNVSDVGTYEVVVSNAEGSVTSSPAILSIQQPPGFMWANRPETNFRSLITGVATDENGNVYGVGNFMGSLGIGNIILTNSAGIHQMFVAKFGADGKPVWVRQAGGGFKTLGNAVAVDDAGNVFVTGSFFGTAQFGTTNLISSAGGGDVFIAKYGPDGQFIWVQSINEGSADVGNGIAVDRDGDCLVTGALGDSPRTFFAKYGSGGNLVWMRKPTFFTTLGASVTVDNQKNVIFAGNYASTVNFGSSNLVQNAGSTNIFLAKYDSLGNLKWALGVGGNEFDTAAGVATDESGNIFLAGNFQGEALFGTTRILDNYTNLGALFPIPGSSKGDIFLAKYNDAGNLLWVQSGGSRLTDRVTSVGVDKSGNAYITGRCAYQALFSSTEATNNPAGAFGFTAMYDAMGSLRWIAKIIGTDCVASGISPDDKGNVYIGGYLDSSASFDNNTLMPGGGTNSFVAKIKALSEDVAPVITTQPQSQTLPAGGRLDLNLGVSSIGPVSYQWMHDGIDIPGGTNSALILTNLQIPAGGGYSVRITNGFGAVTSLVARLNIEFSPDFQWAAQAGSDPFIINGPHLAKGVATDASENIYVVGSFYNQIRFGTNGLINYSGVTNSDAFLVKYDRTGSCIWARQMGGIYKDVATGITMEQTGDIYVTGNFQGVANFGGITLTNNSPLGTNQMFVAKYNGAGQLIWVRQAAGSGFSEANAIAADGSGNVYVTGSFSGNATFGGVPLSAIGPRNVFLTKWDAQGNSLWARRAGGTNNFAIEESEGLGIASGNAGEVVIVGHYMRTAVFGTNALSSMMNASLDNVFVAKYDGEGSNLWARAGLGSNPFFNQVQGRGVAIDEEGNIFVVGNYRLSMIFGPIVLTNAISINVFLVKYDSVGNPIWAKSAGENSNSNFGQGVTLDSKGNPIICGKLTPDARFDDSVGGSSTSGYVAKYNSVGKVLWTKVYGGQNPSDSGAAAIARSGANDVVLAGHYYYRANFGATNFFRPDGTNVLIVKCGITPPQVMVQATNQIIVIGSNATLRVTANGTGPLNYQWYLNGVAINGATSSALNLTNVHAINAGSYSVTVSNPSGAINSTGALLTVIPVLEPPVRDGTNFVITWEDGFALQLSTNGVAGPYYDVPGATSPHTNSPLASPEQFFRLKN